jgi:16S rRNA (cytosine1402-N4)-methyltransferase
MVALGMTTQHISVMPGEVLDALRPHPGGRYIDGTAGGGGHTALLLERSTPDGQILALDADPQALEQIAQRLKDPIAAGRLALAHGNFAALKRLAEMAGFGTVEGILLDLGLSSDQLADRKRGFSFAGEEMLDMRFDPAQPTTAADLVNTLSENDLADLLWRYGEEHRSRQIARRIVQARARAPITQARELAHLAASGVSGHPGGIHPATRTFQALRIAVNHELESLEAVLPQAVDLLAPGGRLAIISFHSLEDRLVKRFFQAEARWCICPPHLPVCICEHQPRLKIVTAHPLMASSTEQVQNPRSRSAKLRVAERLTNS